MSKRRTRTLLHVKCQRCGKEFTTLNVRRLYCSTYCRRQFQNEERQAVRAEQREQKAWAKVCGPWEYDPWARNDLDTMDAEEIYGNTLNDGWTGTRCGLTMCPDEAAGGPMACLTCTRYAASGDGSSSLYGQPPACDEPVKEEAGADGSCSPGMHEQETQDAPEQPGELLTNVDILKGGQDAPAAAKPAPSGKEGTMTKRKRRKRQRMQEGQGEDRAEARTKLENHGEDGGSTGESSRQEHGNIYSQEGGPTMAENTEEKKGAGYMADLAAEALRIVTGDRQREYGEPEHNFGAIANMWNAYIAGIDRYLTPADVANMMMLFKLARNSTGTGTQDTDIDILGYALLGADLRRRQLERSEKADAAKDLQQ